MQFSSFLLTTLLAVASAAPTQPTTETAIASHEIDSRSIFDSISSAFHKAEDTAKAVVQKEAPKVAQAVQKEAPNVVSTVHKGVDEAKKVFKTIHLKCPKQDAIACGMHVAETFPVCAAAAGEEGVNIFADAKCGFDVYQTVQTFIQHNCKSCF